MQIVINTRGAYIQKKDNNFQIKVDNKKSEFSPRKVSSILITTSAAISTDAIYLAIENNIEIILLDYGGKPFGRVWHCRPGSTNRIRRLQLYLDRHPLGIRMVKEWLTQKLQLRSSFIKMLKKRRKDSQDIFLPAVSDLEKGIEALSKVSGMPSVVRNTVMTIEGRSGINYFKALSMVMPSGYRFSGRSKHPARDPFNAMLNYAYGVLYSKMESACVIAGLDPYVGILHTDSYNKLSLVYDIIEMFRPWVEETTVYMFTGRKVSEDFFRETKNGIMLDKPGKQALIVELNDMFEKSERYRRRNMKRTNIIKAECHRFANLILKEVNPDACMGNLRHNEEQTTVEYSENLQADGPVSGSEVGFPGDS